jgi:hypothetical protein
VATGSSLLTADGQCCVDQDDPCSFPAHSTGKGAKLFYLLLPRGPPATARLTHALLLLLSLGMAASGIATVALSGAAPAIFGGAALPDFWDVAPRLPHGIGARMLALLVALHVAAALHHAFIRRDGTLARMGLGRPTTPTTKDAMR